MDDKLFSDEMFKKMDEQIEGLREDFKDLVRESLDSSTKVILGRVYDRFMKVNDITSKIHTELETENLIQKSESKNTVKKIYQIPKFKSENLNSENVAQDSSMVPGKLNKDQENHGQYGVLLVIDDDENTQNLLQLMFRKAGINVISRIDPTKALKDLGKIMPDYILLDLMMPQMNGFEVLTMIRNDERFDDIQIIVGSSRSYDKDRLAALEMGANEFIAKPYNVKQLVKKVKFLHDLSKNKIAS